jgi:VWFA-related protein
MRRAATRSLVLALALTAAASSRLNGLPELVEADLSEPLVVRIDAVVTDARGRPIENLKAEEFELLEDAAPRPIDGVRFFKAGATDEPAGEPAPIVSRADEQVAAAQDGARVFAIFLDEYHLSVESAEVARQALTRFVDEGIAPRDLLLVIKPLDSLLTLRLTRDRALVRQAIARLEGRKGEYRARNPFEQELIAGTPQRIELVRSQIATSALNALAHHLAGLDAARKSIIFVSEGYARTARRRGDEALPSLDTAVRTASRARVPIVVLDPSEEPKEPLPRRDTLRALAEGTDGQVILSAPDPGDALVRMVRNRDAYYLITFRSAITEADGRFHSVQVTVRRPNVVVSAQKGYWAPSADDMLRARLLARPATPPRPPEPPRHISPLIRPWFGMARGEGGATRISFVWEPAVRSFGERARALPVSRLTLTASTAEGTPLFEGVVQPASGAFASDDDAARAVFEAAPGRLKLRMRIEDAAGRVVDTDVRDLIVRPLNGPVAIGSAEIIRARSARDFRAIAADARGVPTPSREFSRSERLIIRVPIYAQDGEPEVTAQLVGKPGGVMRTLPITARPTAHYYQIDLPLAGLASGSYVVQLVARSGAAEAKDELALRVTP